MNNSNFRKLTVSKDKRRVKSMNEVIKYGNKLGVVFPENLALFISMYEGLYLNEDESYYVNNNGILHELNSVLYLKYSKDLGGASIEAILEGHKEEGIEGFIPFGIDSGGWDYNVSINKETYGQVWVNKFDSGEENTMEYVAPSFEEFINGLRSPE